MSIPVRQSSNLLGSFVSPVTLVPATPQTSTVLDMTANAPTNPPVTAVLCAVVIIGVTPPTTATTIAFLESLDGTNYETTITYVCSNVASTRYSYYFTPSSDAVQKMKCTITPGATTNQTGYVIGNTEQV